MATVEVSRAESSQYVEVRYEGRRRWLRTFHIASLLLIYKLFGVRVSFGEKGKVVINLTDEADRYVEALLRLNPYSFRKYRRLFNESEPQKVLDRLVLTVIANELS